MNAETADTVMREFIFKCARASAGATRVCVCSPISFRWNIDRAIEHGMNGKEPFHTIAFDILNNINAYGRVLHGADYVAIPGAWRKNLAERVEL